MGCRLFKAPADVAFLGDSLTQGWYYPRVNLGIYGNTTLQMLARFPGQIPGHQYRRVVILGGTNDVLTGMDPAVTVRNIERLARLSEDAGAQPILCEIPPIFHGLNPDDSFDYSSRVRVLNQKIVQLAATRQWKLIDYYDPILGHRDYSSDGVHMTHRGYVVMQWTFQHEAPSS